MKKYFVFWEFFYAVFDRTHLEAGSQAHVLMSKFNLTLNCFKWVVINTVNFFVNLLIFKIEK